MKAFNISPRALWRAVTIAAVGVIASTAALAMRVSPMVLEMETRGSAAVGRLEIQNLNPGKLAFETRVTRMEFDESGNIKESPADEDFLVFPPQGVLPTNGRQVVRLQWVGPPELPASRAYYVSVNQLPVALDAAQANANGAQVQIVYHMKALVVVAPPGASPNVEAIGARPIQYQAPAPPGGGAAPPPGPGVEVTLKNSGRRHAMMAGMGWRLEGTDSQGKAMRIDIKPEELNRVLGTGYVPALGERSFKLPLVEPFAAKPIKVSFTK
ncbi:fimbria/pilus periplasmic chaperone [Sphingosinicella sp. BN140058]|uniref:fimbria/pilus periplasmic chaperone n=1 Tax=Sphingosinicella sp. BN140058 TaxID=1892855 RepID=UPI0010137C99|nr:fimbria/pilus periplasmic chaperone [Sphingosinicella sp. BN140058]QAY75719.1 molecular chaperone [Sphingosinicella sp. BN140058]